jgi:hypothetical protein
MRVSIFLRSVSLASLLLWSYAISIARAEDPPYSEGHVWNLTFIRVKPGMLDVYIKDIFSTYKKAMDEAKQKGLILSYKFLVGNSSNKEDANFIVIEEYRNFGAYDGLQPKFRQIFEALVGNEEKRVQLSSDRGSIREILGSKDMQEIIPKQ